MIEYNLSTIAPNPMLKDASAYADTRIETAVEIPGL